jgi:hypothetical protein
MQRRRNLHSFIRIQTHKASLRNKNKKMKKASNLFSLILKNKASQIRPSHNYQ